ncbi:MAG: CBS domain-containing protein [Gammaproteobacteria bacterium]|nr:CBS domain-containing protein [Gammaproteobacteria bacterium]
MRVNELMTSSLFTVNEHDTLVRARELMLAHRIRHLPVIDSQSRFIGLLSQRDLLAVTVSRLEAKDPDALDTLESSLTVGEVMNREIVAVDEETDLDIAAQLLLDHKFGCLPVLRDGYLTGIVTEADFVRLAIDFISADAS